MISTSVGGSPVELMDASVSAQSSLGASGTSTSTELDDLVSTEDEIDNVETVTTAAALGVIKTTTTTVTKTRSNRRKNAAATAKHSARLSGIKSPVPANSIGLDVEMRHVEEMENMVGHWL